MDQSTLFSILSIVSFSLAGVFVVVSFLIWYRFDIHKVIGDLSGRSAKKALEKRRSENERSAVKSFRSSPVAANNGARTLSVDKPVVAPPKSTTGSTTSGDSGLVSHSGVDPTTLLNNSSVDDPTAVLASPNDVVPAAVQQKTALEQTVVLNSNDAISRASAPDTFQSTTVLDSVNNSNSSTTVLSKGTTVLSEGTTVLSEGTTVLSKGTTVLSQDDIDKAMKNSSSGFEIIQDIVLVNTDEDII